ncbi:MAG: glycosyltransferase 87 family protein [Acidimicrobiia bacterium]
MIVATLGTLLLGFVLQLVVYNDGGRTSLSDLPHLVLHRGVGPGAFPYLDRALEYPVGSGLLFYLATLVSPTPFGVLVVTAIAATVSTAAITVALERRVGGRAWRWAVGPPVLLFAFQNWDVFAIAAMVLGILAFERNEDVRAGALLGVGAVIKLFPAFLVPPLAVLRWAQGDRRSAARLMAAATVTFGAVNLPVLFASPSGWWYPIGFQGRRQATWGTVWFWAYRVVDAPVSGVDGARFANSVSFAALALGLGLLSVVAARRPCDPLAVAAVAVTIFVLTNKVYSPTYDFWLVPFFVLLPIRRSVWVAFCAVDLAIYILVFGYFHGLTTLEHVHAVLPVPVFARAAVLIALIVGAMRVINADGTDEPVVADSVVSPA